MSTRILFPLAMLYVDGRKEIEGITRFQKLVFLAQKEGGVEEYYDFYPDKYGPFSSDFYHVIDILESKGLIRKNVVKTRAGNEKFVYSLTPSGIQLLKEKIGGENEEEIDNMLRSSQKIKRKHNDEPLERLLRYVYNKYEEYTEESELDL